MTHELHLQGVMSTLQPKVTKRYLQELPSAAYHDGALVVAQQH